jgi:hypothetical protein
MRVRPPVKILIEEQTVKGQIVVASSEGQELWRAAQDIHKLRRMDLGPLETAVRDAMPVATDPGGGAKKRKPPADESDGSQAADETVERPKKESRKERKKREQQERYEKEVVSLQKGV